MQKPLEIPAAAAKEPVLVLVLLLLRVNALRNTKDWKSSREESHARLPRIPKIPVSPHPMPDEVAPALIDTGALVNIHIGVYRACKIGTRIFLSVMRGPDLIDTRTSHRNRTTSHLAPKTTAQRRVPWQEISGTMMQWQVDANTAHVFSALKTTPRTTNAALKHGRNWLPELVTRRYAATPV